MISSSAAQNQITNDFCFKLESYLHLCPVLNVFSLLHCHLIQSLWDSFTYKIWQVFLFFKISLIPATLQALASVILPFGLSAPQDIYNWEYWCLRKASNSHFWLSTTLSFKSILCGLCFVSVRPLWCFLHMHNSTASPGLGHFMS